MRSPVINRAALADPSWRHWAATVPLLGAHLAGSPWALPIATGLCAVAAAYFAWRVGGLKPYPAQVRVAYLVLLAAGALPGMQWIHWVQLAGTSAMVAVGYCPLVRALSLLPFNRADPLSGRLVWRVLVTEPVAGGLLAWSLVDAAPPAACCSLSPVRDAPRECVR